MSRSKKRCRSHDNRTVEYHCKTHAFFGCQVCFYQHQATCKDMIFIPEVAKSFCTSDEFQDFNTMLEFIGERSKYFLREAKHSIESVSKNHENVILAIKAFKVRILDAIEKLEKRLAQRADSFKASQTAIMKNISSRSAAIQDMYETLATEINVFKNTNRHGDLYIAVAEMKEKLLELEGKVNSINDELGTSLITFDANNELLESLKGPVGLGKILKKKILETVDFVTDINIKCAGEDDNANIICSLLMPENRLVVLDLQNKKVKTIDSKKQIVISDLKLSDEPWSVAKVTDTAIVVTLPSSQKLAFVRTTPHLSVDRDLAVDGKCYGVAYHQGKLVVTFARPHKLEVMDMQGAIIWRVDGDRSGKHLLYYPHFVTVSPEHELIYVSNFFLDNVVCLNIDGSVVSTYKDSEMINPCQAVIDSYGMVYVCERGTGSVHQLTPDFKEVKVLLTKVDGLTAPYSISYNETEGKLYIGQYGSYNVKVYKLRYSAV